MCVNFACVRVRLHMRAAEWRGGAESVGTKKKGEQQNHRKHKLFRNLRGENKTEELKLLRRLKTVEKQKRGGNETKTNLNFVSTQERETTTLNTRNNFWKTHESGNNKKTLQYLKSGYANLKRLCS